MQHLRGRVTISYHHVYTQANGLHSHKARRCINKFWWSLDTTGTHDLSARENNILWWISGRGGRRKWKLENIEYFVVLICALWLFSPLSFFRFPALSSQMWMYVRKMLKWYKRRNYTFLNKIRYFQIVRCFRDEDLRAVLTAIAFTWHMHACSYHVSSVTHFICLRICFTRRTHTQM